MNRLKRNELIKIESRFVMDQVIFETLSKKLE